MKKDFFINNRKKLSEVLKGELIVLSGWREMQWRGDEAAPFKQEANFWYLTGIEEEGWRLIIDKTNKSYLAAPDRSDIKQIFDGGISFEQAKVISGVDEVLTNAQANEMLERLSLKNQIVYTLGSDPYERYSDMVFNPTQKDLRKSLKKIFLKVYDCRQELARLRAIKQAEEIDLIKKAVDLTVEALGVVKSRINDYKSENQIEADLTHHFRFNGSEGHAYQPIVAFGGNAVTLHYSKNSSKIGKSGLVLIDVGACFGNYAADITRTFKRGDISMRQADVHAVVRQAHKDIVNLIKPGKLISDYQKESDKIMQKALFDIDLIKLNDEKLYRKYFPHSISHGLGIDVHDSLGGYKEFQPGMVLTVEPGIYIPEEKIGVRTEDDILVTNSGFSNLSTNLSLSA